MIKWRKLLWGRTIREWHVQRVWIWFQRKRGCRDMSHRRHHRLFLLSLEWCSSVHQTAITLKRALLRTVHLAPWNMENMACWILSWHNFGPSRTTRISHPTPLISKEWFELRNACGFRGSFVEKMCKFFFWQASKTHCKISPNLFNFKEMKIFSETFTIVKEVV